jgi:hypothetical protein
MTPSGGPSSATPVSTGRGGRGSLISSVAEFGDRNARVCLVGLGSSFYDYWPSPVITRSVLGRVAAFLKSLEPVDCSQLKSAFGAEIYVQENEFFTMKRECVLDAFVDSHLPKLQARKAASLSEALF